MYIYIPFRVQKGLTRGVPVQIASRDAGRRTCQDCRILQTFAQFNVERQESLQNGADCYVNVEISKTTRYNVEMIIRNRLQAL